MTSAAFFVLVLAIAAPSQEGGSPPAAAAPAAVERLTEWPQLPSRDQKRAQAAVDKLAAANTPQMEESGRAEALEFADAIAPKLLEALGRARDAGAVARVEAVLDRVLDARHTRLLAAEFTAREAARRRYALWRVSAYHDPGLLAAAESAWKTAKQRYDALPPPSSGTAARRAEAEAELYAASLAAASARSAIGLDVLLEHAERDWARVRPDLRAALPALRGEAASARIVEKCRTSSGRARLAAMRTLADVAAGSEPIALARSLLDEAELPLRLAAINVLRAAVDGAPPLDDLSAFEAVEHAENWKRRLQ